MNRVFTPVRIFAAIGVLATTALVLSFSAGTGQQDDEKTKKRKTEKRIEIVEENGETKVTVTTIENGNKTVETFTGEKAEEYLRSKGGNGQHFHMQFDFDIDTTSGKNAFGFSMNGFGEEIEKELQEMMKELKATQGDVQFDFDQLFRSMDSSFSKNGYGYSFRFDNNALEKELRSLDSTLRNIDIDIRINEDGTDANAAGKTNNGRKRTVAVAHSVVMEDMDKKEAEKDLQVSDVSFYPNPGSGHFTLRYKSESMDMIDISVNDLNGKNVYREKISATGTVLRNIELNEPSGTYVLTLRQGKKKLGKKLIIQ